jgi:hypothetical protein
MAQQQKQKIQKGLPKRHRSAAKKAKHKEAWLRSQERKARNRAKQEKKE